MTQNPELLSSTLTNPMGEATLGEANLDPNTDIFGTGSSTHRQKGLQQKAKIQLEIKGLTTSIDLQNVLVQEATKNISLLDQELGPIEANIQMAENLTVIFYKIKNSRHDAGIIG